VSELHTSYPALLDQIAHVHQQAQVGAAGAVNSHLIIRNWLIGAYLVEYEQKGEDRARYGVQLLQHVAQDLKIRSVNGCSRQMLERMRLFYVAYPQVSKTISSPSVSIFNNPLVYKGLQISCPPVSKTGSPSDRHPSPLPPEMVLKLSWTHLVELLGVDDSWERAFYENECLKGNWSKRQLQRQIGSLLYERTGLSSGKQSLIEHARNQAAQAPTQVADLIRDPYVLEFTGLSERSHYLEKDLEKALLEHLQTFLLELGTGFCFEARQKRITVGNSHDYLDMVFYHRILRCHLLIDLKTRPFEHGDAGQMNFYLNYWKDQMMGEGDGPPVGLLLCTARDQTKVEYSTGGLDHQLFVSRYLVALPDPQKLQQLIETDRVVWEQHHTPDVPISNNEVKP